MYHVTSYSAHEYLSGEQFSMQEDACNLLHTKATRNQRKGKACCTIVIGSSTLARTFFGVRSRGGIVYLSEKLSVSIRHHATRAGIRITHLFSSKDLYSVAKNEICTQH